MAPKNFRQFVSKMAVNVCKIAGELWRQSWTGSTISWTIFVLTKKWVLDESGDDFYPGAEREFYEENVRERVQN